MSDFNLVSLMSAKDDSKVIKVKRLNAEITLNEGDIRVGCDAVLLNFWCGFAEFFFKLRYCGFTKPSGLRYSEISGNFIAGFLYYSVRFGVLVPRLTLPS